MFHFFAAIFLLVTFPAPLLCWVVDTIEEDAAVRKTVAKNGFVSIFNGKDLTGWKGGDMSYWSVQDGALVGESTEAHPCPRTQYLWWTEKKPTDFVFTCKFKMSGRGGNSGIQFRSDVTPEGDMVGYQGDMEYGPNWTGCLYHTKRHIVVKRGEKGGIDEDGTKKLKAFADQKKLCDLVKLDKWNSYEITARGSVITLKINSRLMMKVDDRDKKFPVKDGFLGIQLHQGPFMRVEYKNMEIKIEK